MREAGGPEDNASYSCVCGLHFAAPVSTTVACPHCGVRPGLVAAASRYLPAGVFLTRLAAWLIGLMAIGSIAMWLVVPIAWIYLASQMVDSSRAPSLAAVRDASSWRSRGRRVVGIGT